MILLNYSGLVYIRTHNIVNLENIEQGLEEGEIGDREAT